MIACRSSGGSRPRMRSLTGRRRAEQEEVEDQDEGQRHEGDGDPPSDEPPRSLLSPLEGLGPPASADERRAEDRERDQHRADQHRARRRQPAVVGRRGRRRDRRLGARSRAPGRAGARGSAARASYSGRPVGAGRRLQPCQVSVRWTRPRSGARAAGRAGRRARPPRPCARRRRPGLVVAVRAPISALSNALLS